MKLTRVTVEVFYKPGCVVCEKAKGILTRLHIPFNLRNLAPYVGPGVKDAIQPSVDLGLFSWLDGDPDNLPLVVLMEDGENGERAIKKWTGKDVANPRESWTKKLEEYFGCESSAKLET